MINTIIIDDISFHITIFYNPEYVDCYTILIDDGIVIECFSASENPESPIGMRNYCGEIVRYPNMEKKYSHFGKILSIDQVEETVRIYIDNILSKWNKD